MSTYPYIKDPTSSFAVIDGVTPLNSILFQKFSSAIVAIENELGVNPSGVYTDVRQRLDAIDGYIPSGGFAASALIYQHLEYDGSSYIAVNDLTLPSYADGDTRIIKISSNIPLTYSNLFITGTTNITSKRGGTTSLVGGDGGVKLVLAANVSGGDSKVLGGAGGPSVVFNAGAGGGGYVQGGNGGNSTNALGGAGGILYLKAGNTGTSSSGSVYAGNAYLLAGDALSSGSDATGVGSVGGDAYIQSGITRNKNIQTFVSIKGGNAAVSNATSGNILLEGGGINTTLTGVTSGSIYLKPGHSYTGNNVGKIFIDAPLYDGVKLDKFPIYVNTGNSLPAGLRYNQINSVWQYKVDGESEASWHDFTSSGSVGSVVNILWDTGVVDGYTVYASNYSSGPALKIAKLAQANSYTTSRTLGVAYNIVNEVITGGTHQVYCDSIASPGNVLYLSTTHPGMVTTIQPSTSTNCIEVVGVCFSEKSAPIGLVNIFIDTSDPNLIE
jgi:hypothetical protein